MNARHTLDCARGHTDQSCELELAVLCHVIQERVDSMHGQVPHLQGFDAVRHRPAHGQRHIEKDHCRHAALSALRWLHTPMSLLRTRAHGQPGIVLLGNSTNRSNTGQSNDGVKVKLATKPFHNKPRKKQTDSNATLQTVNTEWLDAGYWHTY